MTEPRALKGRLTILVAACFLVVGTSEAQIQKSAAPKSTATYEDLEVRLPIPRGWKVASASKVTQQSPNVSGVLVLEKGAYRLKLGYHQGHASGIIGGRFIEAFEFGWPGLDDIANCAMYLGGFPEPANRNLIFINLILDIGDPKVQENCGIPHSLGYRLEKNGTTRFGGERRWFGGYFTTAEGGYFFGSNDENCDFKAYTLTPKATVPNQFPEAETPIPENNPDLARTIQEAIDIVNSIHYKRCAPF